VCKRLGGEPAVTTQPECISNLEATDYCIVFPSVSGDDGFMKAIISSPFV